MSWWRGETKCKWNLRRGGTRCAKRPTVWINLTSQFQRIWGGQVRVGRGHGQDEGVWIGDEGQDHLLYLSLDVLWLVANGNLKQQSGAAGITASNGTMERADGSPHRLQWCVYTSSINQDALPLSSYTVGLLAKFTFVIPGKSTSVRFRTLGEKIFRYMGSGLIPWTVGKK